MPETAKSGYRSSKLVFSWVFLVGIILAISIVSFSIIVLYKNVVRPCQYPIIISPAITLLVAVLAFGEYFNDKVLKEEENIGAITAASALFLALTTLICTIMTHFTKWETHLAMMGILFTFFFIWDRIMIHFLQNKERKLRVKTGHTMINIPSLIAIILIFIFLNIVPLDFMDLAFKKDKAGQLIKVSGYESINDIFVAGVVSFHLVVSASSYFITEITSGKDK